MMASRAPAVLDVYLGEVLVGGIVALSARESVFTFEPSYVQNPDRPVLSQGFLDARGALRVRGGSAGRIIPYFANLLPEGDLRTYIAEHAGIDERDHFALLWLTGQHLLGAVIVRDPQGRDLPPIAVGGPRIEPPKERLVRFSLPGVQLKFSAMHNAHGGFTIRASGDDGKYIVKLPSLHFPNVPQNELAMMTFASRVGLDVPECSLIGFDRLEGLPNDLPPMNEREAFIIRRFDRDEGRRIHIEDFNQVYRQYPDAKYDNHDYNEMGRDVYRLMGQDALGDFIRRLVFCVAIGNTDMHLKNWSLVYHDGRTPQLAPVYDMLCTSVYPIAARNQLALQLGGVRAFNAIDMAAFDNFARRADLASRFVRATVRDMRDRILTVWPQLRPEVKDNLAPVAARIDEIVATSPLFVTRLSSRATRRIDSPIPGSADLK